MSSPDLRALAHGVVLRNVLSGWGGYLDPKVDTPEDGVPDRAVSKYAVALSSGTAAPQLGPLAFHVMPGAVVSVASMMFTAASKATKYVGTNAHSVEHRPDMGSFGAAWFFRTLEDLTEQRQPSGATGCKITARRFSPAGRRAGEAIATLPGAVLRSPVIEVTADSVASDLADRLSSIGDVHAKGQETSLSTGSAAYAL